MAMQVFEVMSNIEWTSAPAYLYTDPEVYNDLKEKAMKGLEMADGDYMEFYYRGMKNGSGFLKEREDEADDIVAVIDDDVNLTFVNEEVDLECRWQGPHVKIFKDGNIQLSWDAKHTSDECWAMLQYPLK